MDKYTYVVSEKISVTREVRNTGSVLGSEVVQVSIGKPKSKEKRAEKELKGFKKIYFDSGQASSVDISIDIDDWTCYD